MKKIPFNSSKGIKPQKALIWNILCVFSEFYIFCGFIISAFLRKNKPLCTNQWFFKKISQYNK